MAVEPNHHPHGESCNTCSFAGTHIHGSHASLKGETSWMFVRCLAHPPTRRGICGKGSTLKDQEIDTIWPVTTLDDWCGDWEPRRDDQKRDDT